ncbi:putative mariner transposase [Trichonephila clavipes]|nr:putative mariner transposase [Trichonephila clavipes]
MKQTCFQNVEEWSETNMTGNNSFQRYFLTWSQVKWADIENYFQFLSKGMPDIKIDDNCLFEVERRLKKSTVEKWFAKFKRGETSTEDDGRSGRPKEAVTDENIKKVHKIIFDNLKVKFIEIAETLNISKERVGHIVNEYLDMRKLCSKWVPRELTIDPKQQRIDDSKQCLELLNSNKSEFLRRYVTMDETWPYISHRSPIDCRPSGLHVINRLQSVKRRKSRLARLWHQYSEILKV